MTGKACGSGPLVEVQKRKTSATSEIPCHIGPRAGLENVALKVTSSNIYLCEVTL